MENARSQSSLVGFTRTEWTAGCWLAVSPIRPLSHLPSRTFTLQRSRLSINLSAKTHKSVLGSLRERSPGVWLVSVWWAAIHEEAVPLPSAPPFMGQTGGTPAEGRLGCAVDRYSEA